MQKVYKARDYLVAFLVMLGCALFILYPVNDYGIASFVAKLLFALYTCIEEFRKIFSGRKKNTSLLPYELHSPINC